PLRASRGGGGPELAAAQAGGAPAASPGGTERTTTTTSTEVSKPGPTECSVGPGFFVPRRISQRYKSSLTPTYVSDVNVWVWTTPPKTPRPTRTRSTLIRT